MKAMKMVKFKAALAATAITLVSAGGVALVAQGTNPPKIAARFQTALPISVQVHANPQVTVPTLQEIRRDAIPGTSVQARKLISQMLLAHKSLRSFSADVKRWWGDMPLRSPGLDGKFAFALPDKIGVPAGAKDLRAVVLRSKGTIGSVTDGTLTIVRNTDPSVPPAIMLKQIGYQLPPNTANSGYHQTLHQQTATTKAGPFSSAPSSQSATRLLSDSRILKQLETPLAYQLSFDKVPLHNVFDDAKLHKNAITSILLGKAEIIDGTPVDVVIMTVADNGMTIAAGKSPKYYPTTDVFSIGHRDHLLRRLLATSEASPSGCMVELYNNVKANADVPYTLFIE